MRPRGEVRVALHQALSIGPGTARELAARIGASVCVTQKTISNMVAAGAVVKSANVRRPGVKRPVPVYSAVDATNAHQGVGASLRALERAWRGAG